MSLTEVFLTKIRLSYTGLGHPNDRFKSYRTLSVGVWALPSGRVESKKVCYQQVYPVQFFHYICFKITKFVVANFHHCSR